MARGTRRIDWLNHGLEFIVVIIGILIAFQLNQCSTDKQQRETVQIHLQQIDEEASFNKWSIGNSIKLVENNTRKLDSIFIFLDRGDRYDEINRLSIELLNLGGAYIRKNAYQNLTESGDVRFVEEFDVKKRIINLYEYYKWLESHDEISRNLYMNDYYPYLKGHFDLMGNTVQDQEVYESNVFKNILGAYKRSNEQRLRKYKDCIKEIDKFLGNK